MKIHSIAPLKCSAVAHSGSFCLLPFALCLLVCFSPLLAVLSSQPGEGLKVPPQEDRALSSVVQLVAVGPAENEQNRECSATGFLIDEEGYLITNAHVVEDAKKCLEKAPGAKILAKLTTAPGNDAPIGGLKVVAESGWFAARPSGTEDVYKLYAESFRGPEHLAAIQEQAREIVAAAID